MVMRMSGCAVETENELDVFESGAILDDCGGKTSNAVGSFR